ncbi:hypothetical protein DAI22_01g009700 [Oryza sativa Japonica Group]|nr:hypothetical protein DAI22_01g009700 [Oryza sativa Japonica Group]
MAADGRAAGKKREMGRGGGRRDRPRRREQWPAPASPHPEPRQVSGQAATSLSPAKPPPRRGAPPRCDTGGGCGGERPGWMRAPMGAPGEGSTASMRISREGSSGMDDDDVGLSAASSRSGGGGERSRRMNEQHS